MSYRTFKRLLGENSLERKCRFLLGGGLLLLIAGSFLFTNWRTSKLVSDQWDITGRQLVPFILFEEHLKWADKANTEVAALDDPKSKEFKNVDLDDYSWSFHQSPGPVERHPKDTPDWEVMGLLEQGENEFAWPNYVKIERDANGEKVETEVYQYFGAVRASDSCVECHKDLKTGDFLGMVKISFPRERTNRKLAKNNAILLTTAIVTTVLAMLAAYAIVRYVIVKPVLHLKDVSDAVARGNMDLRADIRTGDEFEELSHAFNRMLRHLVAVQEELRQVNSSLDSKVDELAQVNMRLFETNKLKSEFLTTMSHELRTPLNSILGFSDVLAGADNLDEKQFRYLQNIQGSGKDLLGMINDVLDLAKIESGKMELHLAEFRIGDTIQRLVDMIRPLAVKKNIDMATEIDPRLPTLRQDAGKIQQILYNLLSNAVKFTPEGGRIRVSAELDDDAFLHLVVDDTGVGIPLDEQATIFEKFRQGSAVAGQDGPLTREHAGTGLGLSIVKELSKLLGGEVTLVSEVGKGSSFAVRLPTYLPDQPPQLHELLKQETIDLTRMRRLEVGLPVAADPAVSRKPAV